jgi:hypothetical protein
MIALIFCLMIGGMLALSGLILVLLGLARKNKRKFATGIVCGLLAFILVAGSAGYVTVKVYGRLSHITWEGVVTNVLDFVFDTLTTTEQISVEQAWGIFFREPRDAFPEIKNFRGIRIDFPGFDNYYLRYNAPKEFVLDMAASMPFIESSLESDVECKREPRENEGLRERLFPTVPPVLKETLAKVSFWKPDEISEKEYFTCLKFPWSHTIVFDKSSDVIYHVVEQVRE